MVKLSINTSLTEAWKQLNGPVRFGPDREIGIELEAEGDLNEIRTPFWNTVRDGSLRNGGLEYILTAPVGFQNVENALAEFEEATSEFTFEDSIRTSCHVHVNAAKYTFKELYTILGAYWLFEDSLLKICGPTRIGNLFCLGINDANNLVHSVLSSIKSGYEGRSYFLYGLDANAMKYAALNLAALSSHASLEFRGMRGIYTKKEILPWVSLLRSLIHNAVAFKTPESLYRFYRDKPLKELVAALFGDDADQIFSVKGWEDSVKRNGMYLAQLARMMTRGEAGEFKQIEQKTGGTYNWGTERTIEQLRGLATTPVPAPRNRFVIAGTRRSVMLNDDMTTENFDTALPGATRFQPTNFFLINDY